MYALAEICTRAGLLWRSDLRAFAVARLAIASALAMVALGAALAATARSEPPGAELVAASGALHQHNTRGGAHILRSHSQMGPGDEVEGRVKIKNTGDVWGAFTLVKQVLIDPAARASQLRLRVHDMTGAAATPLYDGNLATMPASTPLPAPIGPGAQREYRFTVAFVAAPAGGYARATTSVEFLWGAQPSTPPAPAPPPAPVAPPAQPPAPAPAPTAPAPARTPAAPKTPVRAPARAPSKAKTCVKKLSAKKLTAAARKRAPAACKKKAAKKSARRKTR